jgi:hypothetical protein
VLYKDYLAGEDEYILAFGGTDDDVWAGEWDDWFNNIEQGLGRYAAQYRVAMQIADALVNNTPGIPACDSPRLSDSGGALIYAAMTGA